ncbi:MAG: ABC transporter permease [Butyricicoccus pullicaecorum]|nr:ABC transporter permease [Butyricicoccus pullicaecorum]
MMTALRLEFLKSRRRGLMLTTLMLVGFEVLWIYMAFRNPSANEIQIGWMELLYQVPALNSIIFPVTAAVIASRLSDVEHRGETWKMLETMQRAECLFHAKFLCGAWYLLLSTALLTGCMLVCGKVLGYAGEPDIEKFVLFFIFQLFGALEIFAVQLTLSVLVRNQMISLCIGCGGAFIGLLLMFVPLKFLQYLLPWGHASLLYLVYMVHWDPDMRILELAYLQINWIAFALTVGAVLLWNFTGGRLLARKEV